MRDYIEGGIRLQAAAARPEDRGRAIARVSRGALRELGTAAGGAIELAGGAVAVAIAAPAHPADEGIAIIRLDAPERRRARVRPGDMVRVRATELDVAERVLLAPAGPDGVGDTPPHEVRHALLGRFVKQGETVSIAGMRDGYGMRLRLLGLDLLEVAGEPSANDQLVLRIVATEPAGRVCVVRRTDIRLLP